MCGIICEAFIADLHQACDTGRSGRVKKKDAAEGRFSPFDTQHPLFIQLLFPACLVFNPEALSRSSRLR